MVERTIVIPDKKLALLIGCSKYEGQPDKKQLPAAPNDVKAFKQILTTHWGFKDNGQQIVELIDQPIIEIKSALDRLVEASKANYVARDTGSKLLIVIYYSGHGIIFNNRTYGQAGSFDKDDYIPIELIVKKLAARANTFVV